MMNLKSVLRINALSSGITGIGLLTLHAPAASLIGTTDYAAIIGVGAFLFLFALLVFRESRRTILHPKNVRMIIKLDISWVLASLVVVLLQLFQLSAIGYLLIAGVALWVALMAFLQHRSLHKVVKPI